MGKVSGTSGNAQAVPFGSAVTFRHQSIDGLPQCRGGRDSTGERGMNNTPIAEVLVREGIQENGVRTVAPATYAIDARIEEQIDDLLPRIAAMRSELQTGNVEAAARIGHLVGGRSARLGQRTVASLVRNAIVMSRFHVLEQADEALALAERELISKN